MAPDVFRTIVFGEAEVAFACDGGTVGQQRTPLGRLPALRTTSHEGEKTLARICREAGATVRANVKLRDMNVAVGDDERCTEVGWLLGSQLAVDITAVLCRAVGRRDLEQPALTGSCA